MAFEEAFHLNVMTAPTVNIYRNVKNSDVEFFILCLYECACNECKFWFGFFFLFFVTGKPQRKFSILSFRLVKKKKKKFLTTSDCLCKLKYLDAASFLEIKIDQSPCRDLLVCLFMLSDLYTILET